MRRFFLSSQEKETSYRGNRYSCSDTYSDVDEI
jgi:hypothetical protein